MHHHIISAGTFAGMKPYELVRGLMAQRGIKGSLQLAKEAKAPLKQPALHRWLADQVGEPKRSTLEPVAKLFSLPIEALYDEKAATRVARERGIPDPPPVVVKTRPRKARGGEIDPTALELAERIQALDDASIKAKIAKLLNQAGRASLGKGYPAPNLPETKKTKPETPTGKAQTEQ